MKKNELSNKIKSKTMTIEDAQAALKKIYIELPAVQKSFGETVEDIMRQKKLTKKWGNRVILDAKRAADLTELNEYIFRRNMYKNNCVIDMGLIISLAVGFELDLISTQRLLQAAGLDFRLENPEHIAYLFLLDQCKGMSVVECNEILTSLGIPETKLLGSRERPRKKA